ncbi:MAG: DUF3413 domain-containing protein [Helicobacteraceae bacterium]|nr:DUF3413 domain-containing protein [Helicobacteraceae bacterium]
MTAVILSLFLIFLKHFTLLSFCTALIAVISSAICFFAIIWIAAGALGRVTETSFIFPPIFFLLFDLFLAADFFVYRTFQTHINAKAVSALFSERTLGNIEIGVSPIAVFIILTILFLLFQVFLIFALPLEYQSERIGRRINRIFIMAAFSIVLIDKSVFAVSSLFSYTEITEKTAVIPYYIPLTINKFAKKYFDHEDKNADLFIGENFKADNTADDLPAKENT